MNKIIREKEFAGYLVKFKIHVQSLNSFNDILTKTFSDNDDFYIALYSYRLIDSKKNYSGYVSFFHFLNEKWKEQDEYIDIGLWIQLRKYNKKDFGLIIKLFERQTAFQPYVKGKIKIKPAYRSNYLILSAKDHKSNE